jgi:membrane protease YdiL (CAAX protease family)
VADPNDPPAPSGQPPWGWPRPAPPPAAPPPPPPAPWAGQAPPWTSPYGQPDGAAPPGPDGARPGRNPLPRPPGSPRMLRLELGLVLLLAFGPSLVGLLLLALGPQGTAEVEAELVPSLVTLVFSQILSWGPILVIGYLLARSREGWPGIGLTRFRPGDLGMGLLLWVASYVLVIVLAVLFQYFGQREVDFLPEGLPLWFRVVQAVLFAVTAGVTEEIVVRGYAQTRLEQLRAPTAVILLLPTLLWAVFHVYQGLGVAMTIAGLGLLYAWYFQRTRRLWPIVLAHILFDMTQLVRILTGV